jgi:hypothetical protein
MRPIYDHGSRWKWTLTKRIAIDHVELPMQGERWLRDQRKQVLSQLRRGARRKANIQDAWRGWQAKAVDKLTVVTVECKQVALLSRGSCENVFVTKSRRVFADCGYIVARLAKLLHARCRDLLVRQDAHRHTRASGSHRSSAAVSAA